jgi:cell division protein FtsB
MRGEIHPRLVAELRDERATNDKLRLEIGCLKGQIIELHEECEANREMIAALARAAGRP